MLGDRWQVMYHDGQYAAAVREGEAILAGLKNTDDPRHAGDVRFTLTRYIASRATDRAAASRTVEAFVASAPKDQRGAELLMTLYSREPDPLKKESIRQRVADLYPNSPFAAEILQARP